MVTINLSENDFDLLQNIILDARERVKHTMSDDDQESIKQSQEIKELYNKIIASADENARFTLR